MNEEECGKIHISLQKLHEKVGFQVDFTFSRFFFRRPPYVPSVSN